MHGPRCDILCPMRIADVMALVVPPVTELLRRTPHDEDGARRPMTPALLAVRNDRVIASVTTPRALLTLECASAFGIGLAAEALVLAREAELDGATALTYTVMTRERSGRWVVQPVVPDPDVEGGLRFATPQDGGEPPHPEHLQALAAALSQRPMDVTRVSRQDRDGTFGEATFLDPRIGRVVVDAGTVRSLHQKITGLGGQVWYVPASPDAARTALEAGLPKACLSR